MTYRSIAALIAVGVLAPVMAAAQSTTTGPTRTACGDPDLGGVWDFRTITPLERPRDMGDKEFLTEEEAATWTQPWTAVQTFRKANEPVFEYACHEGNYAIPNILSGARRGELAAKAGG